MAVAAVAVAAVAVAVAAVTVAAVAFSKSLCFPNENDTSEA